MLSNSAMSHTQSNSMKRVASNKDKYYISDKNVFSHTPNLNASTKLKTPKDLSMVGSKLLHNYKEVPTIINNIRNCDSQAASRDKLLTGTTSSNHRKKLSLHSYIKKADLTSPKVQLYLPMGAERLNSSKPSNRKAPSLYLKNNYVSTATLNGQNMHSRHSSIERGVTSVSRDKLNSSNGKITGLISPSALHSKRPSNFDQTSSSIDPRPKERQLSISSTTRPKAQPIIKDLGTRGRKESLVNMNSSLNSSMDKLRQTFTIAQNKVTRVEESTPDKKLHSRLQGSTNVTLDSELTIQWRDDIQLDIEKELCFNSCLGQGSFAKVYEGVDKKTKNRVAIKVIDKRKILDLKRRNLIQTEVTLLARMKHPNIGEFYRLIEDHKRLFMVMQLCGSLTLNHFCREFTGKRLNEEQSYAVFTQIVKGVKYMHENNVAHRDLKLTNILIDEHYIVKIIDFGFACEAKEKHKMYCGTPSYMAPEIVEKKSYYPKPVDIWSMGVILYKLLSGDYAFGAEDEPNLKKNIVNIKLNWPIYFSSRCKALITACFEYDPAKRITIEEIEQHPWMIKYKDLL